MSAIHWDSFFFLFFALVTCVFAVAVVVSNNIVRMAAYLVASLCGVAGLFFLSGAQFLGAMQLMLYVGGTVVLLVFGVMLTARGPFVSMRSGGGQWILALLAGGSLLAVLLQNVGQVRPIGEPTRPTSAAAPSHDDPVGRRPGRRPHRQGRSIIEAARQNTAPMSATSCRLKSFPSISWSSSWGPRSWRGPSAVSRTREQGMELSDESWRTGMEG